MLAIGEFGDKTGGDRPREHCICDCVKISRFFCWLCPSYILNEIVKLLLINTFIFLRFFYHGSVSKTFSYTLR